jgi:hypothetical protein
VPSPDEKSIEIFIRHEFFARIKYHADILHLSCRDFIKLAAWEKIGKLDEDEANRRALDEQRKRDGKKKGVAVGRLPEHRMPDPVGFDIPDRPARVAVPNPFASIPAPTPVEIPEKFLGLFGQWTRIAEEGETSLDRDANLARIKKDMSERTVNGRSAPQSVVDATYRKFLAHLEVIAKTKGAPKNPFGDIVQAPPELLK